jgi:hypothetical protein
MRPEAGITSNKRVISLSGVIILRRRKKEEGRRKKEEGRGKKEEERRKKEEGKIHLIRVGYLSPI